MLNKMDYHCKCNNANLYYPSPEYFSFCQKFNGISIFLYIEKIQFHTTISFKVCNQQTILNPILNLNYIPDWFIDPNKCIFHIETFITFQ